MALLIVLLLDSLPVSYGQALLDRLKTYDIVRLDVEAEAGPAGLAVDCRLDLRVERPGPLRFFLSPDTAGLEVSEGGERAEAALGTGGLETLVRLLGRQVEAAPSLLTVARRRRPGESVRLRLRYTWRPRGGWFYADEEGLQTHLSGFWLPTMAHDRFHAEVRLKTDLDALGPGRRERTKWGWRFVTEREVQVVALTVGRFHAVERGACSVHVRPELRDRAAAMLDDIEDVRRRLAQRLGPLEGPLALVVEPRATGAPSYCADSFLVVTPGVLRQRLAWIQLVAHEAAHRWWGHSVATPLIGKGGTFLREGLAEWTGTEVAGAILGDDSLRRLWRHRVRVYLGRADLRRPVRARDWIFANEPTLRDATYLDDPVVPYFRGALVLRALARRAQDFDAVLRRFAAEHAGAFTDLEGFAAALDDPAALAYYARTSRVPDLELRDVRAGDRSFDARVTCADRAWPGGPVPVLVETEAGGRDALVVEVRGGAGELRWRGASRPVRVEVDPERIFLDPIRSNHVWSR